MGTELNEEVDLLYIGNDVQIQCLSRRPNLIDP